MRCGAKLFAALGVILLMVTSRCYSQSQGPTESQVKAAFIYNFPKFVTWPDDAFQETNAPLVVGLLGKNPFGGELEKALSGKFIGTHPIKFELVKTVTEAKACHVLFIGVSDKDRLKQTIGELKGAQILTVGDQPDFARSGGIINFVREGDRIHFEINANAATAAHLKISSKLLSLAVRTKF